MPLKHEYIPTKTEIDRILSCRTNGDLKENEKLLLDITQRYPAYPLGWEVLSEIHSMSEKKTQALQVLQKARFLQPENPEIIRKLGALLLELNLVAEAVETLNDALRLEPDLYQAHNNLGIAHLRLGEIAKAEENFKTAIRLNPNSAQAYCNLGTLLAALGKQEAALENLNRATELKPDYYQAYLQLTALYQKAGRRQDALIAVDNAGRFSPLKSDHLNNLAIQYIALEKYREAEAKLNEAIRLKPDFYEAYNNLAVVFEKVGNLKKAEESYEQAIKLKPDWAPPYRALASLLIREERKTDAIECLRKICLKNPDSFEVLFELGRVLTSVDSLEEAEKYLKAALKINPTSCDVLLAIGDLYVKNNRLHEACMRYREVLRLNPASVEAYCNLGAVLNDLKIYDEAEECLNKSLAFGLTSPISYYNLSLTVANQNRFDEAKELATIGLGVATKRKERFLLIEHLLDLCQKRNARDLFDEQLSVYSEELWSVKDIEFDRLYADGLFKTGTMFSPSRRRDRFRFLIQKLQEVLYLDGYVAECGCFKGLSSFLMCSTMKKLNPLFKGVGYQIFDSFEGLSMPSSIDQKRNHEDDRAPPRVIISSGHFSASVETVKQALDQFPDIEFFKGWIPDTFPVDSQKRYKFVHIDVDLYQPTFDSFEYFWPLINTGGIMLCDDFNWSGAKKAVEDFSLAHDTKFYVSEFSQAYFVKR